MVGNWSMCTKNGDYIEYKISKKHMIVLMNNIDKPIIFKTNISKNEIHLTEYKNGDEYLLNNDKFILVSKGKNKIILKSVKLNKEYILEKADFSYEKIDSTNLDSWNLKIMNKFKKRTKSKNCQSISGKTDNQIDTLNIKMLEEGDLPKTIIIDE